MSQPKDAIAIAERHAREAEQHVAHQIAIVAELDRNGHKDAAERARKVLSNLQNSLTLARKLLSKERVEREDFGSMAERHVRKAEEFVSRQQAIVERLERAGKKDMAERARNVLATLRDSLELSREHVRMDQRAQLDKKRTFLKPQDLDRPRTDT